MWFEPITKGVPFVPLLSSGLLISDGEHAIHRHTIIHPTPINTAANGLDTGADLTASL